eukprot:TRINITY_DN38183_c0_g1_i1.p1 TRINITY_DN38183_c0_g1~~TRINITY_DN38183_c0_g1_i1.p1  ORF type:complete len:451 (+),score=89.11 TRINITY_DN38183_c0_g1_i1:60-1412(+)
MTSAIRITQMILAFIALFSSAWILLQLAPSKPWRSTSLRVRSSLVFAIAAVDLLYAMIHVAAAVITRLPTDGSKFCSYLGPVLYFAIFSVYITIANLAHYSYYRLTRRTTDRSRLLRVYAAVWLCSATVLTIAVSVGLSLSGSEFVLTEGYCHADQNDEAGQIMVVTIQAACYFFTIFVAVYMHREARSAHSELVVVRQQSVVAGYIAITVVIGVIQTIKLLWYYSTRGHEDSFGEKAFVHAYMILNLLWPTANCVVFVVVSRQALRKEGKKAVGFNDTEPDTGQPLALEDKDSATWRQASKTTIVSRRQSLSVQLQPAINDLLPVGHHAMARQFARKIVKRSGSIGASVLIGHPAQLRKVVIGLWRDRHPGTVLPESLLLEGEDENVSDFTSASDEDGADDSGSGEEDWDENESGVARVESRRSGLKEDIETANEPLMGEQEEPEESFT